MDWSCCTVERLDYPLPIYIIFSLLNSHLLFFNYIRALFTLAYGSSFFHFSIIIKGRVAQSLFLESGLSLSPSAARQFSAAISPVLMFRGTLQSLQPAPMCTSSENRLPCEPFIRSLLTSRRNNSGVSLPLWPEAPGNVGRSWAEVVRCALLPTPDGCMRLLQACRRLWLRLFCSRSSGAEWSGYVWGKGFYPFIRALKRLLHPTLVQLYFLGYSWWTLELEMVFLGVLNTIVKLAICGIFKKKLWSIEIYCTDVLSKVGVPGKGSSSAYLEH